MNSEVSVLGTVYNYFTPFLPCTTKLTRVTCFRVKVCKIVLM